jgi:hypothetical protein
MAMPPFSQTQQPQAAGVQIIVATLQNLVQAVNALTAQVSTQFGTDSLYTVAKLPSGLASPARAFVSDSTVAASTHFGATVVGGGSNLVPVYWDNATWKIG